MCSIASWEQCAFPTDSYKLTSNGNCELRPGKHKVRWRQHFFGNSIYSYHWAMKKINMIGTVSNIF